VTAVPAVAGLLLAAGAGRRMGLPKALVELDGEPLVRRGVRLLRDGGCAPVVVVVGAAADRVRPLCDDAEVVEAADWSTGMGASLRAGLAAVGARPAAAGCVVALVDQPGVTATAVQRLRTAHAGGAVAAVAAYDGRQRNPVLLDRSTWADVAAAAQGDEGARTWLRAHPELVVRVDCTDAGSPDDLDTPQDLAALAERPHPHDREAAR
jgi:CTP:molybdopterin cytidylyltransferase MocA